MNEILLKDSKDAISNYTNLYINVKPTVCPVIEI